MMSVDQALKWASRQLQKAGVNEPYTEAQLLLSHVLKVSRLALVRDSERLLSPFQTIKYKKAVGQRRKRRPAAYILGHKPFMHWHFYVGRGVLIPRPETEMLVELATAWLSDKPSPLVADIGTGSGAVGLSIAALLPEAVVHAVDVSRRALAVARRNARMLNVSSRVYFHRGDLLAPLQKWQGEIDCITANLPYLTPEEYSSLSEELYHEPRRALVAEPDVLSLYRRMLSAAGSMLRPGGLILLEVGSTQGQEVERIFREKGFVSTAVLQDLAGHGRVVRGQKRHLKP